MKSQAQRLTPTLTLGANLNLSAAGWHEARKPRVKAPTQVATVLASLVVSPSVATSDCWTPFFRRDCLAPESDCWCWAESRAWVLKAEGVDCYIDLDATSCC